MTLFWISTCVVVLVSLFFVIFPMIQRSSLDRQLQRDELNKAFYKNRLSELEEENNEGLVDNQEELVEELKQSLLDDIPEKNVSLHVISRSWPFFLLSSLFVIALSYGLYAQFGASGRVDDWQKISDRLPELSKKLLSPESPVLTDQEMQDLTLALRTRLHYSPQDSTGWLLLGRIAIANRDVETAIGAMQKANKLKKNDVDIMLGYAQALMLSGDDTDRNQARELLIALVQRDSVDLRVFSLLAYDAFDRKDYTGAIKYWSAMQKMIGASDGRYIMLSRNIEEANRQLAQMKGTTEVVKVKVLLSSEVTPSENAALIVSIHSADGASMPVAAARYPSNDFPIEVTLSDVNSMLPERKLSSLDQFLVRARLDSDGNVATKRGDWYGESNVIEKGKIVVLTINQQY